MLPETLPHIPWLESKLKLNKIDVLLWTHRSTIMAHGTVAGHSCAKVIRSWCKSWERCSLWALRMMLWMCRPVAKTIIGISCQLKTAQALLRQPFKAGQCILTMVLWKFMTWRSQVKFVASYPRKKLLTRSCNLDVSWRINMMGCELKIAGFHESIQQDLWFQGFVIAVTLKANFAGMPLQDVESLNIFFFHWHKPSSLEAFEWRHQERINEGRCFWGWRQNPCHVLHGSQGQPSGADETRAVGQSQRSRFWPSRCTTWMVVESY